jgi:pyruvate/2-oxoglutarate dehydrogenase complex dihydrolipoamide dehydrogenase (E3) component
MERVDLAIIGSGPGTVVVPPGAAQRVALIEGATLGAPALIGLYPDQNVVL